MSGEKQLWPEDGPFSSTALPDFTAGTEVFVSQVLLNRSGQNETAAGGSSGGNEGVFESKIIIPLYLIIFILSVVGNTLVLVTLIRDKRMRTVTNVYLLNLAVSDLLLGVFCMPFTLVGQVLRNFIFGSTMCKLIPYFQAVSVSVAVWTLVAISLERYFAICRPLKSRRWQTQFHAYKMIGFVWLASLFCSGPILIVSSLQAMKRGHKCREEWPSRESEQIFNLFLDIILLLTPMAIMSIAYSMIVNKLWKGLQREIQQNSSCQKLMLQRSCSSPTIHDVFGQNEEALSYSENGMTAQRTPQKSNQPCSAKVLKTGKKKEKKEKKSKTGSNEAVKLWLMKGFVQVRVPTSVDQRGTVFRNQSKNVLLSGSNKSSSEQYTAHPAAQKNGEQRAEGTYTFSRHAIRSNFMDKSIEAKKKVIRMLFVIVAEFFICWAPLHILNTWYLFYPNEVYKYVGSTGVSLVQLLAYISSCCNPITYCFMNRRFKQAFIAAFNCWICCCKDIAGDQSRANGALLKMVANNSDVSCNDSTIFVGRASGLARSEVLVLEAEDRV